MYKETKGDRKWKFLCQYYHVIIQMLKEA
jgi:hypothetical protein